MYLHYRKTKFDKCIFNVTKNIVCICILRLCFLQTDLKTSKLDQVIASLINFWEENIQTKSAKKTCILNLKFQSLGGAI